MKQIVYFFIVGLFFITPLITSAQTGCLKYPSNSAPATDYGVSWDVTSTLKELLIKSNCPTSGNSLDITIGRGNTSQYIWSTMYVFGGSSWTDYTLTGTAGPSGWLIGQGDKTITTPFTASITNPLFFVGYVCTPSGSSWKCGCRNASCTTKHWQLQAYTGIGGGTTGGTSGGSSTGGTGGTTGGGASGFVQVAQSQCVTKGGAAKPFSQGVHTETQGSGAAFTIGGSVTDLRGVTLRSIQNAFKGPPSILNVKNFNNACIFGGKMEAIDDPFKYTWIDNHAWAGGNINIDNGSGTFTIENMVLKHAFQDAVTIKGAAPQGLQFSMRGIWIINNDDDWIQNDNCSSLNTIEDILVDGTRQGLSMRPGSDSDATCSNFKFKLRNSLINHVCVKGTDGDGITSSSCPNGYKTGQFFKLSGTSMSDVGVEMENVLFRIESMPVSSCKQLEEQHFNNSSTYSNVVVVWDPKDGKPWPNCNLPSGWSVKTGAEGRALWNNARAEWLSKHGCNEAAATCTFADSY